MRTLVVVLGVCATLTMASTAARAQRDPGDEIIDAETRARASFNAGTVFFEAGNYEEALASFQVSYDASSRPELLFNIALCEERLLRYEEAIATFQRFGAAGAPGHDVAAVQERVDHLRVLIAERGPLPVAASESSESSEVTAEVVAEPDTASIDTTPYVAITGFAIAAVGLVGFAILGPLTLVEDGNLADCSPVCSSARVSALEAFALGSDIALGTALAGAILGTIGIFIAPSGDNASASLSLTPTASPGGFGLSARGAF